MTLQICLDTICCMNTTFSLNKEMDTGEKKMCTTLLPFYQMMQLSI